MTETGHVVHMSSSTYLQCANASDTHNVVRYLYNDGPDNKVLLWHHTLSLLCHHFKLKVVIMTILPIQTIGLT